MGNENRGRREKYLGKWAGWNVGHMCSLFGLGRRDHSLGSVLNVLCARVVAATPCRCLSYKQEEKVHTWNREATSFPVTRDTDGLRVCSLEGQTKGVGQANPVGN